MNVKSSSANLKKIVGITIILLAISFFPITYFYSQNVIKVKGLHQELILPNNSYEMAYNIPKEWWYESIYMFLKRPIIMEWVDHLDIIIYPDNQISKYLFTTGFWEPLEMLIIKRLLDPGATFIDIGANQGIYSILMSKKVGDEGKIIAFEPSIRELKQLNANIKLNNLNNIKVMDIALSDQEGEGNLIIGDDFWSGHNTLGSELPTYMNSSIASVKLTQLDQVLSNKLNRIDVMKSDIEGGEYKAFLGGSESIKKFRPIISFEMESRHLKRHNIDQKEIIDFFKKQNYKLFELVTLQSKLIEFDSEYKAEGNFLAIPEEKIVDSMTKIKAIKMEKHWKVLGN